MDGHGQARTNTDGMAREYAISQEPPAVDPALALDGEILVKGEDFRSRRGVGAARECVFLLAGEVCPPGDGVV